MMMSTDFILMVLAVICFFFAAIGATVPRLGLVPLGLMFWALTSIV